MVVRAMRSNGTGVTKTKMTVPAEDEQVAILGTVRTPLLIGWITTCWMSPAERRATTPWHARVAQHHDVPPPPPRRPETVTMALETEVAARSLKVIAAVIHLLGAIVAAPDEMRHADRRRVTMTPILNKERAVAGTAAAAVVVMTVARHHQHEGDTPRTVRRYVAAATERAIAAEVTTIRGATTTVTATITGRLDARPIDPATTHVVKPVNDAASTGIEVVAHAVADVPRMTPPVRCHPVRC